ncbi:MAG TPA: cytochrome c oxidase subunit II [Alcaligenes sp.]|nr:cytochrome c oxidase subunit II [Alcaligenes sp.]HRL27029.1 cytochrome c oxidase subunit II [Alcaligenes sp.]
MKMWRSVFALSASCTALSSQAQNADMAGGPRVNQLNLHTGVTPIAQDIAWLHWMMLIICTIIFIGVFGVMFYSIIRHRKSKGAVAARFHEHLGVEVAWTIIPFLIVIGMALPATKTVVAMKDTTSADMTVKVTGYQWKWGYEYLDGPASGVKFLSNLATPRDQIEGRAPIGENYLMEVDEPLVVPVNKKIRVVLTAEDVIHSWMVPEFGVKQDAIPGFLRDTWFRAQKAGIYRGQCAELCGKDHAYMPVVVQVLEQPDYEKWAQDQQKKLAALADDPNKSWTPAELIQRGEKVYAQNCVACHQANGKGIANTFPALDGSTKFVLAPKKGQIETVLNGHPGTAMAAFRNQLNDVQIASVITYTRNAWSNAGKGPDPVVMPADVKALR